MFEFKLSQVCYADYDTSFEHLTAIPHIQQRRLSDLAKLALNVARQTQPDQFSIDYFVWTSCYGEEQKTLAILHDIAEGHLPSPTQFSTSVHNAIAGLYAIAFQDASPSISLSSAITHSWQDAILEAYAYLKAHRKQYALLVYYDEPSAHNQLAQYIPKAFAMSAVMSLEQPNIKITATAKSEVQAHLQPVSFLDFWQSKQQEWHSNFWLWQKIKS